MSRVQQVISDVMWTDASADYYRFGLWRNFDLCETVVLYNECWLSFYLFSSL